MFEKQQEDFQHADGNRIKYSNVFSESLFKCSSLLLNTTDDMSQ
jgi:hypothetical protein